MIALKLWTKSFFYQCIQNPADNPKRSPKMKVAVSWTGGKDSALACYKAMKQHEVKILVNFMWEKPSLSHPLLLTKLHSEAIQKQFLWDKLTPPYKESYKESIIELRDEYGIEAIVTGDITEDSFHGKWIDQVCKGTGVKVIKPLWEQDREKIIQEIITADFKVIFTCVKKPWFTENWLGRIIDNQCFKDLKALHEKNDVDICGEFGEYHTIVLDAPFFKKTLQIIKFKNYKTADSFIINPIELALKPKHPQHTQEPTLRVAMNALT